MRGVDYIGNAPVSAYKVGDVVFATQSPGADFLAAVNAAALSSTTYPSLRASKLATTGFVVANADSSTSFWGSVMTEAGRIVEHQGAWYWVGSGGYLSKKTSASATPSNVIDMGTLLSSWSPASSLFYANGRFFCAGTYEGGYLTFSRAPPGALDGTVWSYGGGAAGVLRDVKYCAASGRWIVAGSLGFETTTNGIAYTTVNAISGGYGGVQVDGLNVTVAGKTRTYKSTDGGVNWTYTTNSTQPDRVAFHQASGKWLGYHLTDGLYSADDPAGTWTLEVAGTMATPSTRGLYDVGPVVIMYAVNSSGQHACYVTKGDGAWFAPAVFGTPLNTGNTVAWLADNGSWSTRYLPTLGVVGDKLLAMSSDTRTKALSDLTTNFDLIPPRPPYGLIAYVKAK